MNIKRVPVDWRVLVAGLIVLGAIEITALLCGHNGTILTVVIGVIGFILGVTAPVNLER